MPAGKARLFLPAAALLAMLVAPLARAEPLPADAGIINVRDYGARGNGRDDDTAALIAAIAASGGDTGRSFWHDRMIYLPDGTYLVSGTLVKRYANGGFASGLFLMGQSRARTIIRLADKSPGFGDPRQPRAVVFTTSKQLDGTPTSGGKQYAQLGEGNDAYMNFVQDLTIDVGSGNPGAVAIDYLANNIGAVRNVTLRSGPGGGAVGLSMTRKWPGPALIQNVHIQGFDIGVATAQTEYGLTFDRVQIDGHRTAGISNNQNVLALHDLTVRGTGPALVNQGKKGLIAIDGGRLEASAGTREPPLPIDNAGIVVTRRLMLAGYPRQGTKFPTETERGILHGRAEWSAAPLPAWSMRPIGSPQLPRIPLEQWANAGRFGAAPGADTDSTEAVARAFASGASVVYLPHGEYWISDSVEVPRTVRRIVGMNSTIRVLPKRRPSFSREAGMLRIASGGEALSIENLALDNTDLGQQLGVDVAGPRDVIIRDVVSAGVTLLDRKPGGGRVFIENVCCGRLQLAGPQPVFARQLDTEGGGVRILNSGAPLWLLGLKTEGIATVLDNRDGARSDIVGGLIYMVRNPKPAAPVPAFRNAGGWLSATFAEESLRAESRYAVYLANREGARTCETGVTEFPERGLGRTVPALAASPGETGGR